MKPKNGRYGSASRAEKDLELRLELFGKARAGWPLGIVSGEVVKGTKVLPFLSSALPNKGLAIATESGKFVITADLKFGKNNYRSGAKGSLRLEFDAPGKATLRVKCPTHALDKSVKIAWKNRYFRDLFIEIDKVASSEFPRAFLYQKAKWTLKRVFERAGFKSVVRFSDRDVLDVADGWTEGELNEIMHKLRASQRGPWYCYVLMGSYYSENGIIEKDTTGIMFDTESSRGDPAREGCALFSTAIREYAESEFRGKPKALVDREYLMTLVHEVGHALNLIHSFDDEKGRADSLSVMNYPEEYSLGTTQYYDRFVFDPAFDELELLHLHHHSREVTEPGNVSGVDWGVGNFRKVKAGESAPLPPPTIASDAKAARKWQDAYVKKQARNRDLLQDNLELKLTLSAKEVMPGEPLQGRVELGMKAGGNGRRRPKQLLVATSLDYFTQFLTVEVRQLPQGKWKDHRHPMQRCIRLRKRKVSQKAPLVAELPLIYSADGDYFPAPGDYELRVRLLMGYQGQPQTIYSDALPVRVAAPTTTEDKSAQKIFKKRDVRHFLLLRGGVATRSTVQNVVRLAERAPKQAPAVMAKLALVEHANAATTTVTPLLEKLRATSASEVSSVVPARPSRKELFAKSFERVHGVVARSAKRHRTSVGKPLAVTARVSGRGTRERR